MLESTWSTGSPGGSSKSTSWAMGRRSGSASARDCALVRGMAERYGWVGGIEMQKRRTAWVPGELAESQLAEGNPLSRPEQSSEGGVRSL